jgi:Ca-activated chloride channel homolog
MSIVLLDDHLPLLSMKFYWLWFIRAIAVSLPLMVLSACAGSNQSGNRGNLAGFEVKFVVGSALADFCNQAANQFNQKQPKLSDGKAFYLTCTSAGSGDVVTNVVAQANQFKSGALKADDPSLPTLLSVDGEIYQSQLIYQMSQIFPGQTYIPAITDAPLLASSPMVLMAQTEVAKGLQTVADPFKALVTAKTHRDIDPSGPPLTVHYVQTAPTKSNSGLQTLVAQFASVSGKRPERLTVADVQQYQNQIQQIQRKVTRYGISTHALAQAMVKNGTFWASVGSVYEYSVIAANTNLPPGAPRYQAVYPKATFSSNMRAILPQAPWVNADEKAAAEQIIAFLQSPDAQAIAVNLGLRPGTPGVALGTKFTPEFGVQARPQYDSYRPPQPAVVDAMLKSWQQVAKKPSLVVLVVDSSGSMAGDKLPAVQQTLQTYLNNLGPKEKVALIDFDSTIRSPILVDSTPQGRDRGLQFISGLQADGGTKLYDSVLAAQKLLQSKLQKDAINAVLVLTDGNDSDSTITLDTLGTELKKTGFSSDQRIAFFTVGYGNEGEFNPDALKQIAELNGGYYSKGNPETIAQLMSNLQVEF